MSISRRFFPVGAGSLITTSFVSKAVAYAERTSPARPPPLTTLWREHADG
jgi:hypothetical protein